MNSVEFLGSQGRLPIALGAISVARVTQIGIDALLAAAAVAEDRARRGGPEWGRDMAVRNWLTDYVKTLEG